MMGNTTSRHGYTLIEMAIALAVLGMLTGMMLTMTTGQQDTKSLKAQNARMKELNEALAYHVMLRGRLPCPARPTLPEGDPDFAREDCTGPADIATVRDTAAGAGANEDVQIGILPTRSLGIADRYLYDQWGSRTGYAVVKALTVDAASFTAYDTPLETGVIHITDAAVNPMTEQLPGNVVAYAIVSYGKDKKGGANRVGTITSACDAATLDGANCDNADNIFIDTEINDGKFVNTYYHDIIRWKDLHQLRPAAAVDIETCDTVDIVAANDASAFISDEGRAYVWGKNSNYTVGDGTNTPKLTPTETSGGHTDWIDIDIDWEQEYTYGIRNGGELYRWGGSDTTPALFPGGHTNWIQVDTDWNNSCGIRSTGELHCWGYNHYGELGDGTTIHRPNDPGPTVGGWSDWTYTGLSGDHSCGIRNGGELWCWGLNNYGVLGDGTTSVRLSPVLSASPHTDWEKIWGNHEHTCGLRSTGQAYCWGYNANGRLGDGTTTDRWIPTEIAGTHTDWTNIGVGRTATCGIRGGELYCWGARNQLIIDDGGGATGSQTTPSKLLGGFTDWIKVTVADGHACAARSNGNLYCWGNNDQGQVGTGDTTPQTSPTQISGFKGCAP